MQVKVGITDVEELSYAIHHIDIQWEGEAGRALEPLCHTE